MSRRSLLISMFSARLVRARPKYSSVVRVSISPEDFLFPKELGAPARRVFGDEHGRGRPCVGLISRSNHFRRSLAGSLSEKLDKPRLMRLAASGIRLFSTMSPACSRFGCECQDF